MSAFQLSANHIATMVDAALLHRMNSFYTFRDGHPMRHDVTHDNREKICAMLAEENAKSLRARYGNAHGAAIAVFPRHPSKALNLSPVAILKAIQSYGYQSCEHDEWRGSDAFAFCEALTDTLIHRLKGYDEAETWAIS